MASRGFDFEFEDVVCQIEQGRLVVPQAPGRMAVRRTVARGARLLRASGALPSPSKSLDITNTDILFIILQQVWDSPLLNGLGQWRRRAGQVVVCVEDLFLPRIHEPFAQPYLQLLRQVDLVVTPNLSVRAALEARLDVPTIWVPTACDALAFNTVAPGPRPIDLFSVGRRPLDLHQAALQRITSDPEFFYLFDPFGDPQPASVTEYRGLYRSQLHRAHAAMVQPAKFDRPEETGGHDELGSRYFEAMAAGTLLVGSWPQVPEIEALLGTPCSMIATGSDPNQTLDQLKDLRTDPATPGARLRNSRQALLRHDWSHRWQIVLDAMGCDPLPALAERQTALKNRAIALE